MSNPQYPRNPTAPAFNSGLPLAASAKCVALIDGSTATPKDWVGGANAVLVSVLTRTAAPVAGVDSGRNNQGKLTFTTSSQAVEFAGRGISSTDITGSFTLFATFRQTNTGNALVCGTGTATVEANQTCAIWVNQTAGNQVLRIRNAGNAGGTVTITGAAGHQISTAWVFNAGTTTLNYYWFDHDAGTSGAGTVTEPFNPSAGSSAANFYLNCDDNPTGSPTFNFAGDIYQAGNATRAWSQTDFNQYANDSDCMVRPGTATGSPTIGTINTNLDVALDGSAVPGEVAAVFTGATTASFAIDQGAGPTNSSIVSVTVTDATHCTVRVAMGTTAGSPQLRLVGSEWQVPLTANSAPVTPTGYTLAPPSTSVNSGSAATLTIAFTPGGSAFGTDTTFTPQATGPSTPTFSSPVKVLANTNSGTFTVTPQGAGTFAISLTNPVGLADPAAVSVVATSGLTAGTLSLGTINAAGVTINYTAASGGVGTPVYRGYRLTRPGQAAAQGTDLGVVTGGSFTDAAGPAGQAVWYLVTATDSATPAVSVSYPALAACRKQPDIDLSGMGDSIAGGIMTGTTSGPNGVVASGGMADALAAQYGPAELRSIVVRNYCRGGTSVADWQADSTTLWPGTSVNLWGAFTGNAPGTIAGCPATATHILIHLGLVDVTLAHGAGDALATWAARMRTLIANIRAFRPAAKVLVSLLPWTAPNSGGYSSPTVLDAGYTADMNDWILGQGAYVGRGIADYVNVFPVNRQVFGRIADNPATLLDPDLLHHSTLEYGYDARNVVDDMHSQLAPLGTGAAAVLPPAAGLSDPAMAAVLAASGGVAWQGLTISNPALLPTAAEVANRDLAGYLFRVYGVH